MNGWLKTAFLATALYGIAAHPSQASYWHPQENGPKRVVIDKSQQVLRAYEGNRLVLETHISSGRRGRETPNGHFHAQAKDLMHYSRLYGNAPMPYSVHLAGNYFIHGFSSVPDRPASHGCIRVPLTGGNPARQFYDWVHPGTPVDIVGGQRS